MTFYLCYVNGHPFGVYADTLDEATACAAVHLAFLHARLTHEV